MKKVLMEKSVLESLYVEQGKTIQAIAQELGRDKETVRGQLKLNGIPIKKTGIRPGQKLSTFHRSQISKAKTGNKNPGWKGGRVENKGYIFLHRPNHPCADTQGYIAEHRLVMEKRLGRLLLPSEIVHHINGIIDDNRDENLQLFSSAGYHRQHHRQLEKRAGPQIQEFPSAD